MAQASTENAKKLLKELCYKVLSSPIFVNDVFKKFGVKDISITRSKIFNIMINCAIELFEEIVKEKKLDFEQDSKILENKSAVHHIMACLIIALKMYGAHDWIKDANIIFIIIITSCLLGKVLPAINASF